MCRASGALAEAGRMPAVLGRGYSLGTWLTDWTGDFPDALYLRGSGAMRIRCRVSESDLRNGAARDRKRSWKRVGM